MINEHRENERNNNDMPESDLLYTLLKVQDLESGIEKMGPVNLRKSYSLKAPYFIHAYQK